MKEGKRAAEPRRVRLVAAGGPKRIHVRRAGRGPGVEPRVGPRARGRSLSAFWTMMGVAALMMSATAYTLWPRITVVVSPRVSEVRTRVAILASTGVREVDIEGARIPAQVVEEVLEPSVVVPASGSLSTGIARARGSVVFVNEGLRAVTLPEGTILATPGGTRFVTLARVVVPECRIKYFMNKAVGMEAGMAEVGVEAEEPGSRGNVAAGRITLLVGRRVEGLGVTNPEPLVGGQDKITPAVAESDFDEARGRLEAESHAAASRALAASALGDHVIVNETITIEAGEPVFSQAPRAPASELRASCRVRARALAISRGELSKVASGRLLLGLERGVRVVSPEVEVEILESRAVDRTSAIIETIASASVEERVEPRELSEALAGKLGREARSILAATSGIATFSLSPEPDETAVLPRFWRWIRVVVAPSAAGG